MSIEINSSIHRKCCLGQEWHNENLYSLNDHSAAEDGYAGDLDLSEWLKLDDWKQ
jgi:hypothetical protein